MSEKIRRRAQSVELVCCLDYARRARGRDNCSANVHYAAGRGAECRFAPAVCIHGTVRYGSARQIPTRWPCGSDRDKTVQPFRRAHARAAIRTDLLEKIAVASLAQSCRHNRARSAAAIPAEHSSRRDEISGLNRQKLTRRSGNFISSST